MAKKRTTDLLILAYVQILIGVICLARNILSLTNTYFQSCHQTAGSCSDYFDAAKYIVTSLQIILFSIFMIIVGIGILFRQAWARWLNVYVLPLILFLSFGDYPCDMGGVRSASYDLNDIILEVLIRKKQLMLSRCAMTHGFVLVVIMYLPFLVYYTRQRVKEQFK